LLGPETMSRHNLSTVIGFEFFRKIMLREVNFGERTGGGNGTMKTTRQPPPGWLEISQVPPASLIRCAATAQASRTWIGTAWPRS